MRAIHPDPLIAVPEDLQEWLGNVKSGTLREKLLCKVLRLDPSDSARKLVVQPQLQHFSRLVLQDGGDAYLPLLAHVPKTRLLLRVLVQQATNLRGANVDRHFAAIPSEAAA